MALERDTPTTQVGFSLAEFLRSHVAGVEITQQDHELLQVRLGVKGQHNAVVHLELIATPADGKFYILNRTRADSVIAKAKRDAKRVATQDDGA